MVCTAGADGFTMTRTGQTAGGPPRVRSAYLRTNSVRWCMTLWPPRCASARPIGALNPPACVRVAAEEPQFCRHVGIGARRKVAMVELLGNRQAACAVLASQRN